MASQPKNAEKLPIHSNYFQGGTTIDPKLGIPNSFYQAQSVDFRSQPSQMTVLPGMADISQGVLKGTITAMDQDVAGNRWAITDNGYLYKLDTSSNVIFTEKLTSNGAAGLYYDQITDQLYIPGQTTVSMYGQVTTGNAGQPNFKADNFAKSASVDPGCVNLFNPTDGFYDGQQRNNAQGIATGITNPNQVANAFTNSYKVLSVLSEGAQDLCFFAPDIEPFYSIAVYIATYSSGNLVLTLHDASNNQLAQVTIANPAAGWNEFVFSGPVRALVQQSQTGGSATYHWHLTSSGSATVATYANGDLSGANFLLFAYRLVAPNNGWHPTAYFNGLLCIGNGQYLSTYDFSNDAAPTNAQWVRHQLVFKHGYEVCGLSTNNQYLVIALERRSTSVTHNYQDGQLVFWDGSSNNPAFFIDIPMGAPYGLQTFNNVTYFVCAGSLFAWSGGQTVVKVRKLAYQNTNYLGTVDTTIVNPNMMAVRYNLLMIGYPSTTTNVNLNYGVYTWGAVEVMYPNSLGYDYVLSNGLQNASASNNLTIGCVYNFVDTMYVSWSYVDANSVTHYGLDLVNNSSAPAPNFSWRSLIWDGGTVYKTKEAYRMQVTYQTLPAGTTLYPYYNVNRTGDVVSTTSASAGSTKVIFELGSIRFHEIQWGFVGTSGSSPVQVTGVTMEVGPLPEETNIGPNSGE